MSDTLSDAPARTVKYRCCYCGEPHELTTRLQSRLHWHQCPRGGEWNRVEEAVA